MMAKPTLDSATFDLAEATIDAVLRKRARQAPDKVFLNHLPDGRTYTYQDVDQLTRKLGSGLLQAGLERGSHVAIFMENSPEQLFSIWGASRAGLVSVPLNSSARGQLLAYFLKHSDSRAIIVEAHLLPRFLDIAGSVPDITHVIVAHACRPGMPEQSATADAAAFAPALRFIELAPMLETAATPAGTPPPHFTDLAMLMFTSGTTGPSKAIMFTHAQLIYWGTDVSVHHEYTEDDIAYVYLPLFHGNALLGSVMGSLMAGASIALAHRFSTGTFWQDIRASGATVFNSVGAVTNFLWVQPASDQDGEHRVKRCHLAPVPKFGAELEARFGMKIMSAFGLTDYCLGASYNTQDPREKLGSAGKPRQNIDIRIVDEYDQDMPVGEPGEIVLRNNFPWGASIGYYKAPEATLASRRNLWFHTGDRGVLDEDGYLWYTDRLKDAIRRRGENISAFEVEEVIRTHPAVQDVAVYPLRSELSEDEVAATLVLRPGVEWSPEALIEHCNKNLAYFMVPRYIDIIDQMPMTLSQKIEKYKLKQRAEQNRSDIWDRELAGVRVER